MHPPTEHLVCPATDLPEGVLKEFTIGDTAVLLARVAGQIHAVGATCPHYALPLKDGILHGTRLRCPWHHSCFDITTGAMVEPPSLDDLPRFPVRIDAGQVFVRLPLKPPTSRPPACASHDSTGTRTFAIVGGGAAGVTAAQTLRAAGYRGRLLLITAEDALPYDRPALSKNFLNGEPLDHPLPLHPDDFYSECDIEPLHQRVTSLDPATHMMTFADGTSLHYDAALLATGSQPRKLDVPGESLEGVFTLRSLADANKLLAAMKNASRAVVIGSSFIGMETAACMRQRGLAVTVISSESTPFEKILGPEVGDLFRQIHEDHGVSFRFNAKVAKFEGQDRIAGAILSTGERIPTDLAIIGVGVDPITDYLRGIPTNDDGSVTVDRFLRVAEGLYAAGDIARFPDPCTGEPLRIEHWRTAEQHGRVAALNMLGQPTPFEGVPYFWSFQFGVGLDYVGHAEKWDEIHIDGDIGKQDFTAFYLRGQTMLAASGCNRSTQMAALAELMRLGRAPSAQMVKAGPVDFAALLADYGIAKS